MPPAVQVRGLREVNAAFAKADRQTRLGVRAGLRDVAEPVRRDAEQLAASTIPRMPRSPRWSRMRVGVTRTLVYVAPRQRGARGRNNPRARPNLAPLLMDRAMQPALDRHENEIEGRFEQLLDHIADDFNH
jgi:hypothetical protein